MPTFRPDVIVRDFFGLVFPKMCVNCALPLAHNEDIICTLCREKLLETDLHLHQDHELARRFQGRVLVKDVMAMYQFSKAGAIQSMLHNLKYKDNEEAGKMLGQWYGDRLQKAGIPERYDMLVPVPLHPRKQKQRGYNQSTAIAQGLQLHTTLPVREEIIVRTRFTNTQTKQPSRLDRWTNVEGAFDMPDVSKVKDQRILLVDDVITTGATIEECIRTLSKAAPQHIGVVTLACA